MNRAEIRAYLTEKYREDLMDIRHLVVGFIKAGHITDRSSLDNFIRNTIVKSDRYTNLQLVYETLMVSPARYLITKRTPNEYLLDVMTDDINRVLSLVIADFDNPATSLIIEAQ